MTRRWKWVLAVVGLVNVLPVLINLVPVFHSSAELEISRVRHDQEAAYRAHLFEYEQVDDLLESRLIQFDQHSGLMLRENGAPLGPSTRSLGLIRKTGRGAYAHGGPVLIFSTSDNSDPRTNGRRYTVTFPLYVRGAVQAGVLALTAAALGLWLLWIGQAARIRLAREAWAEGAALEARWEQTALARALPGVILLGAIAVINYVMFDLMAGRPCLSPDSVSYLRWSAIRTPGYPLFLQTVLAVFGDARWIAPVQLNLLLLSFVALGWSVGCLFRSRLAGLLVALPLLVTSPLLSESNKVMAEALFVSLVCVHAAAALWLIRTTSGPAGFLAGLTMALAITVRPAGYALLVGVPVLLFLLHGRSRRAQGFLLGGLGLALLAAMAVQYARFGIVGTQSFGGISLIGHVASVITEDLANEYPALTASIARHLAPDAPRLRDPSPWLEHWQATEQTYNRLLYEHILPEIGEYVARTEPGLSGESRAIRGNEVALAIAASAIRAHPGWYARHTLAHYAGLWVAVRFAASRPFSRHFLKCDQSTAEMIERDAPLLPMLKAEWYAEEGKFLHVMGHPIEWVDAVWEWLPFSMPFVVAVLWLATLSAALAAPWIRARSIHEQSLIYIATIVHGYMIFVAAVQVGAARYTEPMLPLLIVELVGGLFLAAGGMRVLWDRRERHGGDRSESPA